MKDIENNKSLRVVKVSLSFGKKYIISLKGEDCTVTRNREEILRRVEEFYKKLYESNSGLKGDAEIAEGTAPKIIKEEISFAIKNIKKGRGDDGIALDILKEAGEYIEDILAKFFTKCFKSFNIRNQWDSATVILLHEKGDKEDLKNYRPISLLPAIYKI